MDSSCDDVEVVEVVEVVSIVSVGPGSVGSSDEDSLVSVLDGRMGGTSVSVEMGGSPVVSSIVDEVSIVSVASVDSVVDSVVSVDSVVDSVVSVDSVVDSVVSVGSVGTVEVSTAVSVLDSSTAVVVPVKAVPLEDSNVAEVSEGSVVGSASTRLVVDAKPAGGGGGGVSVSSGGKAPTESVVVSGRSETDVLTCFFTIWFPPCIKTDSSNWRPVVAL